ncbi:hypothetical protein G6F39_013905 [Rhizopus arrhizus]|nr:hypothetical protein G6F39_013905 [Rhizopus arrhizus]
MQMSSKESIGDYSKKFLQAVYNAGLPSDDPRIADRFLASLTLSVQTLIRVTVARVGKNKADTNEKWTVEYITQVGRDILGDDNKLYAEATALIPGANKSDTGKSRYSENGSRGDGSLSGHRRHQFKRRSQNMTKVNKHYFCTHHGLKKLVRTKSALNVGNPGLEIINAKIMIKKYSLSQVVKMIMVLTMML